MLVKRERMPYLFRNPGMVVHSYAEGEEEGSINN